MKKILVLFMTLVMAGSLAYAANAAKAEKQALKAHPR